MSAAKKKKNKNKNKINNSKDKNLENIKQTENKVEENKTDNKTVSLQNQKEDNSSKSNQKNNELNKKTDNTKKNQKENEQKNHEEAGENLVTKKVENKEDLTAEDKIENKEINIEKNIEAEKEKSEHSNKKKKTSKNKKEDKSVLEKDDNENKNAKKQIDDNSESIKNKQTENGEKTDKKVSEIATKELVVKNDTEETPDYVKEMLKKKKRRVYIAIFIIVLIVLIILFSTIFALLNINNTKLIKGVKIRNIDISNLSLEEAEERVQNSINNILAPEITLKYGDEYNITIKPEQIEFAYKVKDSLKYAYNVGRDGNILKNNYTLLFTTFLGKNIDLEYTYNEELLANFIDDVSSKIPGIVVEPSYYIEDNELIINKGTDGIQVKKEELKQNILKAINNRSIEETSNPEYKQTIEIPTENAKASKIDIEKIYNEVYREPQDAYYETDPYKIYPDVDGIDFNISLEEAKNLITSEDKEEYSIPLKITKANKTIKDLGTEAFPYLVSSFSTKYDASNRNRSINLEIAANKINGTLLMPGDVFSFNKVVGKRTVEEGYKDAKIYADGGVVDGLAGGICQISSTLYNAVLLGNLEIVERRNHSFPTSYVRTGRDATVVYGTIDFQFKNSRSYPIKIEATVKNGIAEFKIHGIQEEKEYEIRILPVTTQSIPYTTSYVQDATLLPGQQVVVQAGQPGYKVTTYIEKRLNGAVVSKEILSNDTYSPMKSIIRVGVGTPVPAQ